MAASPPPGMELGKAQRRSGRQRCPSPSENGGQQIESRGKKKSQRAAILVELRCFCGDGVRPQPGCIQRRLQASNRTHLLHRKKPAASGGGARATAHGSAALLISGINDGAARRAGNGEHPDRSLAVPYTAGQGRSEIQQSSSGAMLLRDWGTEETFGCQTERNLFILPISAACRFGGQRRIFLVCLDDQETKLTSNQEPLRTFDPFSPRANPMLVLNWNQEISWLRSLAG